MLAVLSGVRVLDLGRFIAGPFCAALLADYGADVIRVDRVGGSEDRYIVPVSAHGEGALFLQVNRNKRSITLDIDAAEGRAVLQRLVRTADVVVANMPARTLESLGLDYESLRRVKPDIILTAASAFGAHPSVRDRLGFDGVAQAVSGAVHVTGEPGRPTKFMVPAVDFGAAMASAMGTMMALYERRTSGLGQEVQASLMQTALNMASGTLIEEALLRVDRPATGNRAPHYAPSDIFRVKDGWIITQALGDAMFRRWAKLVGRPELIGDERCADDRRRGEQGELLNGIMADWCARLSRAEALERLALARIPAAPVRSPREVVDDPLLREGGAFHPVEFPGASAAVPIVAPPVALSRTPPEIRRRPPMPGEHTDEVLSEVGYDARQIAELRERGIV
jgi:formyl-CoA transferase